MGFLDRLSSAINAFRNPKPEPPEPINVYSSYGRPDRVSLSNVNDRSIVSAIYNRIALDCASIKYRHVRVDDKERFVSKIDSGLNNCLELEANKDQSSIAFFHDVVLSLFDEGCIAIAPIDTDNNFWDSSSFDVKSMRTAKIIQWFPDYVRVEAYNDRKGLKENLVLPKRVTPIIENPFYAVMNAKNSVASRLIRKLNILDSIDDRSVSGKLDLIIQLPYIIKTNERKEQAAKRKADIEQQLKDSPYGIVYTDGTEKVTQLNRPVENNIMSQVEYLTSMLFSQLTMTEEIMNGKADEKTMNNYIKRTIVPIARAITEEMNRKFLSLTARSQKQRIMFFNDPFELVPVTSLPDIADKFTRNEIMSSNEFRQIIGLTPSDDPRADELRNKNMPAQNQPQLSGSQEPNTEVFSEYQPAQEVPMIVEQT